MSNNSSEMFGGWVRWFPISTRLSWPATRPSPPPGVSRHAIVQSPDSLHAACCEVANPRVGDWTALWNSVLI